jgi:hypothetical protein
MDMKKVLGYVEIFGWIILFASAIITFGLMNEGYNMTIGRAISGTGIFVGILVLSIGKIGLSNYD